MVDLTGLADAVIAGVFSVLAVIIPLILQKYLKDKQSAQVLSNAVVNSLGAIQQAAEQSVTTGPALKFSIPGVPDALVPAVQYVLDHAGAEAARFGITPVAIAEKISAQIGLANIKSNIATGASPAPTLPPLTPVLPPVLKGL